MNQMRMPSNDGFRQPIPPSVMQRPRSAIGMANEQIFRHPGELNDQRMMMQRMGSDPRMRFMQQQQQQQVQQNVGPQQQFIRNQQQQWVRVQQQNQYSMQQQQQQMGMPQQQPDGNQGLARMTAPGVPQSQMQAQFRPNTVRVSAPYMPRPSNQTQMHPHQQQTPFPSETFNPNVQGSQNFPHLQQPIQTSQLPTQKAPVKTSDIVTQLQEQPHHEIEEEVPTEDLDDDELLVLGNDFNILEYADPEHDKALTGKTTGKSNIFDEHFDEYDDKEEELKKNDEKRIDRLKTEGNKLDVQQNKPLGGEASLPNEPTATQQVNRLPFGQMTQSHTPRMMSPMFRQQQPQQPQQPPPPYPGQEIPLRPPPPYPHQAPVRNAPQFNPTSLPRGPMPTPRTSFVNEQPLLLEDLVEQEKRDQRQNMQQEHSHSMVPSHLPNDNLVPQTDSLLSDVDFERLKADILSDEPIANNIPTTMQPQHFMQQQQQFQQQLPDANPQWQPNIDQHSYQTMTPQGIPPQMSPRMAPSNMPRGQMMQQQMPMQHQQMGQMRMPNVRMQGPYPSNVSLPHMQPQVPRQPYGPGIRSLAPPPLPPPEIITEQDKQAQINYERWLVEQNSALQSQQKNIEQEMNRIRKSKKTLNTKQRQAKKGNSELSEQEANELAKLNQEQSFYQKNLEHIRKLTRQHSMLSSDYAMKKGNRPPMMGVSAAVSIPQSPNPLTSITPGMQASPRSVQSPLMAMSSGPGTPIAMGTPGTPQSPSIMSPSPMAPSPSSLMQHSPAASHHSPATLPPSPMVHSPMTQIHDSRPPLGQQQVHIVQDDNNPFSDVYQQKEKMHFQGSTFGQQIPPDVQDDKTKIYRMQFHGEDNLQYPGMQQTRPIRGHPQGQHYQPRDPHMYRYNQPHFQQQQNNPRPFNEMVGQPYPAYQQHHPQMQMQMRRPPPPPYPGGMQQAQQQQTRMYGSPQVAQVPHHQFQQSPQQIQQQQVQQQQMQQHQLQQHPMQQHQIQQQQMQHPQMQPQQMQPQQMQPQQMQPQQMQPQQMHLQQQQQLQPQQNYNELGQRTFENEQMPYQQQQILQSPQQILQSPQRSQPTLIQQPNQSIESSPIKTEIQIPQSSPMTNATLTPTSTSESMRQTFIESNSAFKFEPQYSQQINDQPEDDKAIVSEAKTSISFNIDGQGSGQDNDAINDALLNNNEERSNVEDGIEGQSSKNMEFKIKQEHGMPSSCSHQSNNINQNESSEETSINFNQVQIKQEIVEVILLFSFILFIFIKKFIKITVYFIGTIMC